MRQSLAGTSWRLAVFIAVCVAGLTAMVAVFGQLRFEDGKTYTAVFSNVSGLRSGNFVRIAGVEVGKVNKITINDDATVDVRFRVDDKVRLTEGTRAVVRYENLIGDRYLELQEGAGPPRVLTAGGTIPIVQTSPALNLNALIGGFRPVLRALSPDQVNLLTGQLVQALQGQGPSIAAFLDQTSVFTATLADRDELIGQVIDNLNTVLGSLADQSENVDKAIVSLSELVHGLADRRTDISDGVAAMNHLAGSLVDLLGQGRPGLQNTVHQLDRVGNLAIADHDYLDNLLETLPDRYQILARQGMYGDYFSFYLCDAVLKLNGKGGQPVFVKVAGQSTGRCAPK